MLLSAQLTSIARAKLFNIEQFQKRVFLARVLYSWVKFGDGAVDLYDAELLEPEG